MARVDTLPGCLLRAQNGRRSKDFRVLKQKTKKKKNPKSQFSLKIHFHALGSNTSTPYFQTFLDLRVFSLNLFPVWPHEKFDLFATCCNPTIPQTCSSRILWPPGGQISLQCHSPFGSISHLAVVFSFLLCGGLARDICGVKIRKV